MKIAIIRLSALGDIIISASFVSCLRELFTDLKIDWYVDERFSSILNSQENFSLKVLPLKRYLKSFNLLGIKREYQELKKETYDCVIDMQGLIKSAIIGKIFNTKKYVGFARDSIKEPLASSFYTQKVKISYQSSIILRNAKIIFEALNPKMNFEDFVDFALKKRKTIFTYQQSEKQAIEGFLESGKKNILFILEASMESKTYSAKNFIELGKRLCDKNMSILLLYHQDFSKANEIYKGLNNHIKIKILPKLGLGGVKALIDSIDLVIGGDTGITHLAWAMNKPSITLFGNTPLERFCLTGTKNIALSGNKKANYDKNDFSINKIAPEMILKCIEEIL
ncbi:MULTISPECIES: lipopolysaccharide heptosyltransferase I [unclassified Helicobacter]|uniref:lipopolysaccharide heptosyltransferase I n=1 Tax=unclassified Helicobacter TaxID=2593540 RepID=UPI000CF06FFF|nr:MULTISPECIES: lipopolysaccharide heptosyltransferase I [unclassified Helicobacter]